MSDSDCSNCSNDACPHKQADHYCCPVRKALELKKLRITVFESDLRYIRSRVIELRNNDGTDWIDEELRTLQDAANNLLELFNLDTSHGRPKPCQSSPAKT
jgi:hypothetical protein